MMQRMRRWRRLGRRGQGMTEYIIIIAVVAVLSLVVISKFGNQIRDLFVTSGKQLGGDSDAKMEDRMEDAEVEQELGDLTE